MKGFPLQCPVCAEQVEVFPPEDLSPDSMRIVQRQCDCDLPAFFTTIPGELTTFRRKLSEEIAQYFMAKIYHKIDQLLIYGYKDKGYYGGGPA